jgi:hypothetical protein
MKYIISSNINYYKNTYLPLITSLLDSKISQEDIIMVVGGCKDTNINLENNLNINIIPVEYNSFDLTGLIYISENINNFLDSNYFLLHDTCLVGPKFKELAEKLDPGIPIQTLRNGISLNIGMYSFQTLFENKENLCNLKYYPQNENELQQVKQIFVVHEDIIFKLYNEYCYKHNYIGTESDMIDVNILKQHFTKDIYNDYFKTLENSEIKRQMGYSSLLDFYKFQANWQWGNGWKIGI